MVRQSMPEPRSVDPIGVGVRGAPASRWRPGPEAAVDAEAPESPVGDPRAAEQRADQMLREAFQALAGCEPPANAWPRLAARLNRRNHRRRTAAHANRRSPDPQTDEAQMPPPRGPEPCGPHGGG
jgi:hypothetical protein